MPKIRKISCRFYVQVLRGVKNPICKNLPRRSIVVEQQQAHTKNILCIAQNILWIEIASEAKVRQKSNTINTIVIVNHGINILLLSFYSIGICFQHFSKSSSSSVSSHEDHHCTTVFGSSRRSRCELR